MTKETGTDRAGEQDGVGDPAETAPWSRGWWVALIWGAAKRKCKHICETEPLAHPYFELRFLNFLHSFNWWYHQSVRLHSTRQHVGRGLSDTSLVFCPWVVGKGSRNMLEYQDQGANLLFILACAGHTACVRGRGLSLACVGVGTASPEPWEQPGGGILIADLQTAGTPPWGRHFTLPQDFKIFLTVLSPRSARLLTPLSSLPPHPGGASVTCLLDKHDWTWTTPELLDGALELPGGATPGKAGLMLCHPVPGPVYTSIFAAQPLVWYTGLS